MRVIKTLEHRLILRGADIFAVDLRATCMRLLTEKFAGKNVQSCAVKSIKNIIDMSLVRSRDVLDGSYCVDVVFEVNAIVYIKGEILHGCMVVEKTADTIRFTGEHADSEMSDAAEYAGICDLGYVIPTVVGHTRYIPARGKISLTVVPFVPTFGPVLVYECVSPGRRAPGGLDEIKEIRNLGESASEPHGMLERIDVLESEHENNDVAKFFRRWLYPYKKQTKPPAAWKFVDLEKLNSVESGYVCMPPMGRGQRGAFVTQDKASALKMGDGVIVSQTPPEIRRHFTTLHLAYLEGLHGFVEAFESPEDAKKYKTIWKTYEAYKR